MEGEETLNWVMCNKQSIREKKATVYKRFTKEERATDVGRAMILVASALQAYALVGAP